MPPTLRLDSGYNVYGNRRPKANYPPGTVPPDELAAPDPTAANPTIAAPAATATPTQAPDPTQPQSLIKPRSLSPAVQGLADSYLGKLNAAPVTADQVMGSQEYQERVKPIDLAAGEAQASLRRRMASMGALRGTPAIQAMASSGAYYAAQKGAMASNLIDSAQARQQQDLGNTRNAMGDLAALDNTSFNQGVTEFNTTAPYTMLTKAQEADKAFNEAGRQSDLAFKESAITGRYLPPAIRGLYNQVLQLKQQNAQGQNPALAQQAEQIRGQIAAAGYDPNVVGSDVALPEAQQNVGKAGLQTPQAKGQVLQDQRDQLTLDMAKLEAEIASNPDVGAMAQAQAAMRQKQKQLELTDAQIKQANAKSLSGGSNGGFTAWQHYQIERDKQGDTAKTAADKEKAAAAKEKARDRLVGSFRSDYTVGQSGADLWADFMDVATSPKADGGLASREELGQLLSGMLKNPAVPAADKGWANAMFFAGQGEQWAQDDLNTKYRKKPIDPNAP